MQGKLNITQADGGTALRGRGKLEAWALILSFLFSTYTASSRFFDIRYSFQAIILRKLVENLMAVGISHQEFHSVLWLINLNCLEIA